MSSDLIKHVTDASFEADVLKAEGAVLVDVREADEHARERIPGARHHALSTLDAGHPARPGDDVLIFHCRSGARTAANAPRLAAASDCDARSFVPACTIAWLQ